jgi:hypothetical protein
MNATTNKTPKQTAEKAYAERHSECQDLLTRITRQLAAHQKEAAKDPRNWGHAGDLGSVAEELAMVLAALGDRSAVDAKGISY